MGKMTAAVVRNNPRRIELEQMEIPSWGDSQVLVNVKSNGLCGSDVHGFLDEASKGRVDGLIMGHECTGVLVAAGKDVRNFKVGDRVVVNPQFACDACYACRHGWRNVCEHSKIIGSALRGFVQGAMAEYVVVGESHLHHLPHTLSFDEGAMVEPVANAIHAVNRAGVQIGDNVVVMGAGTIGLCMIQAAKISGASQVIAIDVSDYHLNLAKELGADVILNSTGCDPVQKVYELCGGIGADVTLEAVGLGVTYSQAALMTRKRGTLVFFGAAKPSATIDLYPILHRELNIVGCTGFDEECEFSIKLMNEGKMNVKPLISHHFSLEESETAIKTFLNPENHVIKAMITNNHPGQL